MCHVISVKTHKARKSHHCWWCRGEIKPGETYTAQAQVDSGDFDVLKFHQECDAAWHRWRDAGDFDNWECLDPWDSDDTPTYGGWTGETPGGATRATPAAQGRTEREGGE